MATRSSFPYGYLDEYGGFISIDVLSLLGEDRGFVGVDVILFLDEYGGFVSVHKFFLPGEYGGFISIHRLSVLVEKFNLLIRIATLSLALLLHLCTVKHSISQGK